MKHLESVAKTVWFIAMALCIVWLFKVTYIDALSLVKDIGINTETVVYFIGATLVFIPALAIVGYATSAVASFLGLFLGGMVEAISYLYVRYKPRV